MMGKCLVRAILPLACEQALQLWKANVQASSGPHPAYSRVFFWVWLSHDFSFLPQIESLLAGYRTFINRKYDKNPGRKLCCDRCDDGTNKGK